jgi:hypothetical protein
MDICVVVIRCIKGYIQTDRRYEDTHTNWMSETSVYSILFYYTLLLFNGGGMGVLGCG